jgi:hypothetical protein
MNIRKKGAESATMIIWIIVALAAAGLLIWFNYVFFGTAGRLVDGNDPSVTMAIESCKAEMKVQPTAYCESDKIVSVKRGGDMIVSCHYLDQTIRKDAMKDAVENLPANAKNCDATDFIIAQCSKIQNTGVSDNELSKIYVNGKKCFDVMPDGLNPTTAKSSLDSAVQDLVPGVWFVYGDTAVKTGAEERGNAREVTYATKTNSGWGAETPIQSCAATTKISDVSRAIDCRT